MDGGDQLVCQICGKGFPLGADGDQAFRAYSLAELAIEAESATVYRPLGDGDGGASTNKKQTGQRQLPGMDRK